MKIAEQLNKEIKTISGTSIIHWFFRFKGWISKANNCSFGSHSSILFPNFASMPGETIGPHTRRVIIIYLLITIVFSVACEKYNRGGKVNKANDNVMNTWVLHKFLLDGDSAQIDSQIIRVEELFGFQNMFSRVLVSEKGKPYIQEGSWELTNGNKKLVLKAVDKADDCPVFLFAKSNAEFSIVKLTRDELWYYFNENGQRHEFRFIPKAALRIENHDTL